MVINQTFFSYNPYPQVAYVAYTNGPQIDFVSI